MPNYNGTEGSDFIHSPGSAGSYPGYNEILVNLGGTPYIYGNGGDDVVAVNIGVYVMDGGAGDDLFRLDDGGFISYLFGGSGDDTVSFVNRTSGAQFSGGANVTSIENAIGSNFNDIIRLVGSSGTGVANHLQGLAGDDRLGGSGGGDTIDGGDGSDTVDYGDLTAAVGVDLQLAQGTTGGAFGDTYVSIENATGGSGGDVLNGSSGDNRLEGGAGDDLLFGADGDDTLVSGGGNDILRGEGGADTLIGTTVTAVLMGGAGADHFDGAHVATVSYDGIAVGITLSLTSGAAIGGDADGDTFTNVNRVVGGAFADTLIGSAGNDRFDGGSGNDYLTGRAGADQLIGGAGIDSALYGDSAAGVQVNLQSGTGAGGSAAGDTLSGVENVIGSSHNDVLTGNGGDNGLWGDLGNDSVAGGSGADLLRGDAGNDTLDGGLGADRLDGGAGIDTASYAHSGLGVTVDLGAGTARFGDAQRDVFVSVENLVGSARGDTLAGDGGANMLSGEDSNDRLTGAGGADVLNGGLGGDFFTYRAVGDSTVAVAGRDTIQDFNSLEQDRIDLSQIDADGNAGNGDSAFSFIGTASFTGAGAQVRFEAAGDDLLVEGDTNGDMVADFAILVRGTLTLTAADFVL